MLSKAGAAGEAASGGQSHVRCSVQRWYGGSDSPGPSVTLEPPRAPSDVAEDEIRNEPSGSWGLAMPLPDHGNRRNQRFLIGASAVICLAVALALVAILVPSRGNPGESASRPPVSASRAPAKWSCVATDNGAENPGLACPGGNGYQYSGITNSNGYNTRVLNDMWNPSGPGHPQTIYVDNPGHWQVVSDQPVGNTAVLAYPDVQQLFTLTSNAPAPLSSFSTIVSDFKESMPDGGDNEAAYDIWLGTASKSFSQEVMIWVDDHRTNPPPGQVVARPTFFGAKYTVWDDSGTVYMVRDSNETSGRIDILTMLGWLESHGYSPAGSGLNQIDFGWEICSTGGKAETFTMSRYDLHVVCATSGTACWSS